MLKVCNLNDAFCFLVFCLGVILIAVTQNTLQASVILNAAPYAPPADVEHFSLGYNENMADGLWLRVIQDIDRCDTSPNVPTSGSKCAGVQLGWVFRMLDAITRLAPKFLIVYRMGATILTAIVHDNDGAKAIFDRGLDNFPDNWPLLYNAGYFYMTIGDPKKSADLLLRAAKNGAPGWVYSLAAKLYTEEGQAFLAKTVLKEVLEKDPDSRFAPRLKLRLNELDQILKKAKSENSQGQ